MEYFYLTEECGLFIREEFARRIQQTFAREHLLKSYLPYLFHRIISIIVSTKRFTVNIKSISIPIATRSWRLVVGSPSLSSFPWRSVRCLRLFHEAFVRSIMNSVSFVEGGSFLLAPSKLRSLHRRREGSEEKGHGEQGGWVGGNL